MPSRRRSKRCSTPTVAPLHSAGRPAVPTVIVAGPNARYRPGTHDAPQGTWIRRGSVTWGVLRRCRFGDRCDRATTDPPAGSRSPAANVVARRASGGMADAHGSGPCVRKDVGVQLPPCPPEERAPGSVPALALFGCSAVVATSARRRHAVEGYSVFAAVDALSSVAARGSGTAAVAGGAGGMFWFTWNRFCGS